MGRKKRRIRTVSKSQHLADGERAEQRRRKDSRFVPLVPINGRRRSWNRIRHGNGGGAALFWESRFGEEETRSTGKIDRRWTGPLYSRWTGKIDRLLEAIIPGLGPLPSGGPGRAPRLPGLWAGPACSFSLYGRIIHPLRSLDIMLLKKLLGCDESVDFV